MSRLESTSDGLAWLPGDARQSGAWVRVPCRILLSVVLISLIYWNLLLATLLFAYLPKNDFGRPFWATLGFLQGNDLYALNDSVIYVYNESTILYLWDLNPPHAHLPLLPLAVFPAHAALLIWCVLSGLCLWASLRIILSECGLELAPDGRTVLVLGLLSFTGMGSAVVTGHISFFLLLMVTLAWREARRQRWWRAGAWLGLGMSLKPFLLIFLPYLMARKRWSGLAAAATAAGLAFLAGLLVFGWSNHVSWLSVLSRAETWAWLPMNGSLYGYLSRILADNPAYLPLVNLEPATVRNIWLGLGIPAGLAALWKSSAGPSSQNPDQAFGILLVSALLLSPLGWTYYFWLPVGPVSVLARRWWLERANGGEPGVRGGSASWNLLLLAIPGMVAPAYILISGQPSRLSSLLLGGVTFGSLLLVWLALIIDPERGPPGRNSEAHPAAPTGEAAVASLPAPTWLRESEAPRWQGQTAD